MKSLWHRITQRGNSAVAVLITVLALYSCASIGQIDGGEYDEKPPVFLSSNPVQGALNANKRKISLVFDEYLKLEKANEKVVISPPQVNMPDISANGKKVQITLEDTLKPNTTYTFDFGDAIQDNNEGNPLENFQYSFSTGQSLDTMAVSGYVLNAKDLEPIKGAVVGLYRTLTDTTFSTKPFDRVGKTDSRGHFSIKGIASGEYHIFSLIDADQNYYYSQPTEAVGFKDSIIVPYSERRMRQDTTWIDTLTIDTITEHEYTHFLPDDIIIRSFRKDVWKQRLSKMERLQPQKFSFYFTAPMDSLPKIEGLNFDAKDAFVVEMPTGRIDTLNYWIRDSLLYQQDTLRMVLTYDHLDSLENKVPFNDTIRVVAKTPYKKVVEREANEREKAEKEAAKKSKKSGKEEKPETKFLTMNVYAPQQMDIYDYLSITFNEPLASFDSTGIHLKQKVDTTYRDVPFTFERDTSSIMSFNVIPNEDWVLEGDYSFIIDSLSFKGLYGLHNNKQKKDFKVKKLEDYGQIFFDISGADSTAFVELLSDQDKVLRTVTVENNKADFYYLNPGKYGARLVNDRNKNGKWDTGDYDQHIQPEEVYYYWQVIELKANFDLTQTWDIHDRSLERQKPQVMKRQKPDAEKKKRDRNKERNEKNNKNNNSSTNRNNRSNNARY